MSNKEQTEARVSLFGEDIDEGSQKWKGGECVGWGFFLVFAGLILLFNNLGLIPWKIWDKLWRAWPVLIILAGLRVIVGGSWLARILLSVVSLVLFATLLGYIFSLSTPQYVGWVPENISSYFSYWSLIIK